jgi:hyaluronoglucosaminidase
MKQFRHRGVIEGFYGTPWSHPDRLWLIQRMGHWGMNRYVYAPKGDPLHLARWREPYPPEVLDQFRELVACGERAGVDVGFAVSPGQSIQYSSQEDRRELIRKLQGFRQLGSRLITLALDDVPSSLVHEQDERTFETLADAQIALMHEVRDALGPEVITAFIPSDYLGVAPTPYLEVLGERLDPGIEVGWTGRTVVSPTVTHAEAAQRAQTLRRRLLLWDNVPVADGPMRRMLHLNPYTGRDPRLAEHVSGVWLNPMEQVRASAITLYTAAAYLNDPEGYDPESAWKDALDQAGEGDPEALALFARAHRYSPLCPEDRDTEIEAGLGKLRSCLGDGGDPGGPLSELRQLVAARLQVEERLRGGLLDTELLSEIAPWLASHQRESRCMDYALALIEVLLGSDLRSRKVLAFFHFEAALASQPEVTKASYGPRRVLYPQLVSMCDDTMGFGADPALIHDRCLADEFVALAEDLAMAVAGPHRTTPVPPRDSRPRTGTRGQR